MTMALERSSILLAELDVICARVSAKMLRRNAEAYTLACSVVGAEQCSVEGCTFDHCKCPKSYPGALSLICSFPFISKINTSILSASQYARKGHVCLFSVTHMSIIIPFTERFCSIFSRNGSSVSTSNISFPAQSKSGLQTSE